jgi:hypothetical protein
MRESVHLVISGKNSTDFPFALSGELVEQSRSAVVHLPVASHLNRSRITLSGIFPHILSPSRPL